MKRWSFLIFLLIFGACDAPQPDPQDFQEVTIVSVRCEIRKGNDDCRTYVQFPDSTRRMRSGKWGEEGDVFKARKSPRDTSHRWWIS